jgi:hypothetical protein
MESARPLAQLTDSPGGAVHRYYDVPVEAPGGQELLAFAFRDAIPGPGEVIRLDRDGGGRRVVAEVSEGIGHVGANQCWLDAGRVAWRRSFAEEQAVTLVRDLARDETITLAGSLRSWHEGRGLGLVLGHGGGSGGAGYGERYRHLKALHLWEGPGAAPREFVRMDAVLAVHPRRDEVDPETLHFMNAKWSPDGRRFSVVVSDEVYAAPRNLPRRVKSLVLFDPDRPAARPVYLGEFSHHPMWTPSGSGLVAHRHREDDGQDLLFYPIDGGAPEVRIPRFRGVHSSLDRAERRVVTDAFDTPGPGLASVLLYDLDTGEAETLAAGPHRAHDHQGGCHLHPQWSRDESRIYFNHAASGRPQLYAVSL